MANESKEPEQKIVTRKHIARIEKEKKQKKILLISILSILVVVVLLVTYGILSKTVLLAGTPVAKVNSQTITVDQFQKRVKYQRMSLVQNFLNYQTSSFAQFFQTQLLDVQNRLDDYLTYGGEVLDSMISEAVVAQKAQELGLTVTDEDITKELQQNFGYYANGTPTETATVEYRPTSTFSATQLSLITLTPAPSETPTETQVPATETPVSTSVSPDATEAPTSEVPVTPTATATVVLPTNTPETVATATVVPPTATPYTLEGYNALYSTVAANIATQTNFGDEDLKNYVRNSLYSQKLYDYVTKDILPEQDMVWARHILVATEDDAKLVLEKLNAGEDFAATAVYYSKDTSNSANGGDLGWIYKGQMVAEFEKAAWDLKIGEYSQPVKSSFGYHIIQVLGHEKRQLTADELSSAKSTAYQKYVDDLKTKATIKKFDVWASVVPNEPAIPTEYRIATSATE
jgi:peptidyl-prolyl cis-trans isomerase D